MALYYYKVDGKIHGPMDAATLKSRLASGEFKLERTLIRREDHEKWTPAAKLRHATGQTSGTFSAVADRSSASDSTLTEMRVASDSVVGLSAGSGIFGPIPEMKMTAAGKSHADVREDESGYALAKILINLGRALAFISLGIAVLVGFSATEKMSMTAILSGVTLGAASMTLLLLAAEGVQILIDIDRRMRRAASEYQ